MKLILATDGGTKIETFPCMEERDFQVNSLSNKVLMRELMEAISKGSKLEAKERVRRLP